MAEWKERYLELWNNYSKRQRYMIIGAAALVFIAIVAGSIIYGGKPDMVPLFTNMEAKDAGEVAAKLKENKVNYEIQAGGQGTTILVPARASTARAWIWLPKVCPGVIRASNFLMTVSSA